MNLQRAVKLLSRLHIKDREEGFSVPFVLNKNQAKAVTLMQQQYEKEQQIRCCILKSRRVGMSSLLDGLLFCHCLARPQAHAEICAHEMKTSELGLFRVPHDLAEELNEKFEIADVRTKRIYFFHEAGDSLINVSTAGSMGSGRGLTLSALHLSEAAQYPGADSFLSLLPAVSKGPGTIIGVESTAFGKSGIGEAFYEFWNAACARRNSAEWNGFIPIFLDWLHDPACVRDADEADDAPATDLERELMAKPFHANKKQIAWMRRVMESECGGEEKRWLQEFPHTPSVAFVSTGDPAFPREEMAYAESTKKVPLKRGFIRRKAGNETEFVISREGPLQIWEEPLPKCHYYLGADAAAGIQTRDFAAYFVFNGTTGKQAAGYSDHSNPEELALQCDLIGRWYNNAMVNIELTGNLGRWAQVRLRDKYQYPNIYRWRGKDDKLTSKARGESAGWETNKATRGLMLDAFREKLRDGMKNMPGGLEVYDAEVIRQMGLMSMIDGFKWDLGTRGHDDSIVAAMLAVVTCAQYPPPNIMSFKHNVMETKEGKQSEVQAALHAQPNWVNALKSDLRMILRPEPKRIRTVTSI